MTRSALQRTVLSVALAFSAVTAVAPSFAAAPVVGTQAPGYYRIAVGAFEVTALSDGTLDLPVDQLLKVPAARTQAALAKVKLKAPVETSFNAYLINTGERLVLVDAGAGPLFGPTLGQLVANLRAAGYEPSQVDDVVITHLHPDHVGGIAAQGAAVFPNATVHADRHDAEYWLSPARKEAAPAEAKGFFDGAAASLKPYQDAGRFKPLADDGAIAPGVRAVTAYGHTEGHTVYKVESQGQRLVLVGDLIHVGAVQFDDPEVTINFDTDPRRARAARKAVFAEAAKDGSIVGASHISFPGLGRLLPSGKGYRWVPVNYSVRVKP